MQNTPRIILVILVALAIILVVTAFNISIEIVVAIFPMILTFAGFLMAYSEFKQWRVELIGTKSIELAVQLATKSRYTSANFGYARSGFSSGDEDLKLKLETLSKVLMELDQVVFEFDTLTKGNCSVDTHMTTLWTQYNKYRNHVLNIIEGNRTPEDTKIVYGNPDGDEFSTSVNEATKNIIETARSYIKNESCGDNKSD